MSRDHWSGSNMPTETHIVFPLKLAGRDYRFANCQTKTHHRPFLSHLGASRHHALFPFAFSPSSTRRPIASGRDRLGSQSLIAAPSSDDIDSDPGLDIKANSMICRIASGRLISSSPIHSSIASNRLTGSRTPTSTPATDAGAPLLSPVNTVALSAFFISALLRAFLARARRLCG